MLLERTKDEILIRLPVNMNFSEIQKILDYIQYLELTLNSDASEKDSAKLAKIVNKSIWKKVKEKRGV